MIVVLDLETHLFGQGNMAPKPVCLSWACEKESGLMLAANIDEEFGPLLKLATENKATLIGHNVAYDMSCLLAWHPELRDLIWLAYVKGSIQCTQIREKLLDIAEGTLRGEYKPGDNDDHVWKAYGYDLNSLAGRWLEKELDKDPDGWRLRFKELDGVPLDQWPERATDYAIEDSVTCLQLFEVQHDRSNRMSYPLKDGAPQARGAFALKLASVWGMRTDRDKVLAEWVKIEKKMQGLEVDLAALDLFNLETGSKKVKNFQALIASIVPEPKKTKKGAIKTDADTIKEIDHPIVEVWSNMQSAQKTRGYLRRMFAGAVKPLHTNFDELIATGRTSSSGPGKKSKKNPNPIPGMNIQNCPREPGVRECFVAREGYVYLNADYDTQEMRTLAQSCMFILGHSVLADRYRTDRFFDPHTMFAGHMKGIEYEEAMRLKKAEDETMLEDRQHAKIANFGLPGGMGVRGLIAYARGYDVKLSETKAAKLKEWWFKTWPEMDGYFEHIKLCIGRANAGTIVIHPSERQRGLCGYCDGANTKFQGAAADISKAMFFEVSRRCYNVPSSALYGSRPVNFIHDEGMLESPEDRAPEAAVEKCQIMVEVMERYTPDVPAAASATLSRFWSKKTKRLVDDKGRLLVWEG